MKSLIILVIWFFYKRSHKLIRGKFGLKYVATTKYNLINKVLELYIQYHFINLINHALNNDDLIFEHWMNICAFLVLSIHFLVEIEEHKKTYHADVTRDVVDAFLHRMSNTSEKTTVTGMYSLREKGSDRTRQ